ncbi:hypothetical protein HZ326_18428 [Fusarium oxysporum f. sp. albedinis]|nr:hypothetical protein HZ326_18428 [Fusarium oxysporum f. sp. albedinis]
MSWTVFGYTSRPGLVVRPRNKPTQLPNRYSAFNEWISRWRHLRKAPVNFFFRVFENVISSPHRLVMVSTANLPGRQPSDLISKTAYLTPESREVS